MIGMRDGIVVIPILMGCSSALDVLNPSPTKPKPKPQSADHSHMISSKKQEKAEEGSLLRQISVNNSKRNQSFPKPGFAGGIHKLIQRSSKSFSQVFVYKGHEDEDEDYEDEYEEMVIGAPTDVEHLTHIGIGQWNSIPSTSINNMLTA